MIGIVMQLYYGCPYSFYLEEIFALTRVAGGMAPLPPIPTPLHCNRT